MNIKTCFKCFGQGSSVLFPPPKPTFPNSTSTRTKDLHESSSLVRLIMASSLNIVIAFYLFQPDNKSEVDYTQT